MNQDLCPNNLEESYALIQNHSSSKKMNKQNIKSKNHEDKGVANRRNVKASKKDTINCVNQVINIYNSRGININ